MKDEDEGWSLRLIVLQCQGFFCFARWRLCGAYSSRFVVLCGLKQPQPHNLPLRYKGAKNRPHQSWPDSGIVAAQPGSLIAMGGIDLEANRFDPLLCDVGDDCIGPDYSADCRRPDRAGDCTGPDQSPEHAADPGRDPNQTKPGRAGPSHHRDGCPDHSANHFPEHSGLEP